MNQNLDRYGRSSGEKEYPKNPTWCPGCGNYGIWGALKMAIKNSGLPQEKFVLVYDIGCSGNMADFNQYYGIHALHGRALPTAAGVKLANHDLKVIVVIGDGGGFGEGGNHFINLMRGNHDITVLVHNNQRYSLTIGQTSPKTDKGIKTKSTPEGSIEEPFNDLSVAISNHATFVAREFAADIPRLSSRILEALNHTGFSFIDILQACPTFNSEHNLEWYHDNLVKLEDEVYFPTDRLEAWKQTQRTDKWPIGLFFKEDKLAYHQQVSELAQLPLVDHPIDNIDLTELLKKFQ